MNNPFSVDGFRIDPPGGADIQALKKDLFNVLNYSQSKVAREDVRGKAVRLGCTVTNLRWADKCTLADFTGRKINA